MKFKIFQLAIIFIIFFSFLQKTEAQVMSDDLLLLKIGYIPYGLVSFDKGAKIEAVEYNEAEIDDIKTSGLNYAVQAEYNLIFGIFHLGIGFEYQRVSSDKLKTGPDEEFKKWYNDFILPMMSFKFEIIEGLYTGIGISGKYLISTETPMLMETEADPFTIKFEKEMDAWANYILGYNLRAGENIYINFEGRFGYNLTNKQYKKIEGGDSTGTYKFEFKPKTAYDSAVYIGVGFRPLGPGY